MSGIEFHSTVYGRRFFDGQLPRLLEALEDMNKNLSRLIKVIEEKKEAQEKDARKPET